MKRQFKFRAWARDGEWEENEDKMKFIMIDSDSLCIMDTEPILKDCLKDIEDEIYFMQFTGLLDKNGKEIYESDILRTVNYFDTDNKPQYLHHKVVYDTERAVFNAINLNNENDLLTTNGNCFLYVALKSVLIEVIGNIYENESLLKTK